MEIQKENKIKRRLIYDGRIFKIYRDDVQFPNKNKSVRELVEHSGGVSILAQNEEEKILLIKQYRYPIDEIIYEIPAGKIEAGEKAVECAKRELREESGYQAEKFIKLFEIFPTPGYSTEKIQIYKAENLKFVGQDLDEGEYLEVVPKNRIEITELLKRGKIKDSKTLIALMYYLGDY